MVWSQIYQYSGKGWEDQFSRDQVYQDSEKGQADFFPLDI